MKRLVYIWLSTFILSSGLGQDLSCKLIENSPKTSQQLLQFLALTGSEEDSAILQSFDRLIERLERVETRKKTDYAFLKALFYRTHSGILKEYDRLATMNQTLSNGKFGCLTGTAVYALLLEHFGYDYQIIELPNHVFIHLTVDDHSYVYESTLPMSGFRKTSVELEKLLEQPWVNHRRISQLSTVGDWFENFEVIPGQQYKTINLQQLAGLQYFNESVKHYLAKDYITAMEMVMTGYDLYPSERNEKLMQLIINKILKYVMIKEEVKNQYLEKYVRFVKRQKISQTK